MNKRIIVPLAVLIAAQAAALPSAPSATTEQSVAATSSMLTLEQCRRLAHDNYPAVRQYGLLDQSREFTLSNIAKGWLPRVGVTASAMAFTDIVNGSSPLVKASGMDVKNYLLGGMVSVQQNVYDGGQIAAEKNMAKAQTEMQRRRLDMELYDLNERVEQLYFSVLLLDRKLQLNTLLTADLEVASRTVQSMIKGGTANAGDLETLQIQQLLASQQRDALEAQRQSCVEMLSMFIGSRADSLVAPAAETIGSGNQSAAESPTLSYYSAQDALLDAQKRKLDAKLMPTLSVFAAGALHNSVTPLVNDAFLAGGLTLKWNIGALYTRKNDLKKLAVQRQQNDAQRETFLFNNRLQQQSTGGTALALQRQIARDSDIVRLQEHQLQRSRRRVEAGTESVNEMARTINALATAREQKALHEIQLTEERCRLQTIKGK